MLHKNNSIKGCFAFFFWAFFLTSSSALAQFSVGLTGGTDFDTVNNVDAEVAALQKNINIYVGREGRHFGGFVKYNHQDWYIRVEALQVKRDHSFKIPIVLTDVKRIITDFEVTHLDVPLLLGYNISKSLRIFGGPRWSFNQKANSTGVQIEDLERTSFVGTQLGFGYQYKRFELDVRYSLSGQTHEVNFLENPIGNKNQYINSQGQFVLLGLSAYIL
jgi:hypothetical protein